MIRDFEITDMNSLVKLMEQHATEAGEGVGTFEETNLILHLNDLIEKFNKTEIADEILSAFPDAKLIDVTEKE